MRSLAATAADKLAGDGPPAVRPTVALNRLPDVTSL